jgi:1,4-alpha-glucan branching enzyme
VAQSVGNGAPVVYVQFIFAAQDAQTVAVAGDFNSWQTDGIALRDADGDGVWTGLVALRPGQHKYMFIVNGKEWVTDPGAERYVDDGFGMRNAVINVATPARTL